MKTKRTTSLVLGLLLLTEVGFTSTENKNACAGFYRDMQFAALASAEAHDILKMIGAESRSFKTKYAVRKMITGQPVRAETLLASIAKEAKHTAQAKQTVMVTKLSVEAANQEDPLFHKLSPNIFEPGFKPNLETSWDRIKNTDMGIENFNEVLDFLNASVQTLNTSKNKLTDIMRAKIKSSDTLAKMRLEGSIASYLRDHATDLPTLTQTLQHLVKLEFATEIIFFQVIQARRALLIQNPQYTKDVLLAEFVNLFALLPTVSDALQGFLIHSDQNINWIRMVKHRLSIKTATPVRFNDAINGFLFSEMQGGRDITVSLNIARYLLAQKIQVEAVTDYLKTIEK